MMRVLRLIFIAVTGVVLLTVALANRAPVSLRLMPEDLSALAGTNLSYEVPLFLIILAAVAVGVLIGFVWEWFREMRHRSEAKGKSREVARLERELAVLKDTVEVPKDEVLAILEAPKAR